MPSWAFGAGMKALTAPAGKVFLQLPPILVKTSHSQGTGPSYGQCGLKDAWEKVSRTQGNAPLVIPPREGPRHLVVPALRNQSRRHSRSIQLAPQSPAPRAIEPARQTLGQSQMGTTDPWGTRGKEPGWSSPRLLPQQAPDPCSFPIPTCPAE